MLTNYLIVDQDMSVLDAMKRSSQLMVGNKMTSLLIMFCLFIITSFGTVLTCCVGMIFFVPFMSIATTFMYLAMSGSKFAQQ